MPKEILSVLYCDLMSASLEVPGFHLETKKEGEGRMGGRGERKGEIGKDKKEGKKSTY